MTSMTAQQATVRITRSIPAPADRVFRAWLEPELLRRWMTPGLDVTHAEVDPRVGGHFRVRQGTAGETSGGFEAEIIELVQNERIVFKWGMVGPKLLEGPVYDSRLTVTFRQTADNSTELTLVHERLEELYAAMPEVAGQFEAGWVFVLDKLAKELA
jgi:uncharacterized protein YndB with AHSA1/START domain